MRGEMIQGIPQRFAPLGRDNYRVVPANSSLDNRFFRDDFFAGKDAFQLISGTPRCASFLQTIEHAKVSS
jgi:hypothetical protein